MCEDHLDMENDTINYMQYKMGFTTKIFLTNEAVPKKFDCQEDRLSRLCEPQHSRGAFAKRRRLDLLKECEEGSQLLRESTLVSIHEKDVNMPPEIIVPNEELPKTQERATITDVIITADKSVQTTKNKPNVHYRSKSI
ncbi:uncharacterized protein [Epargyreus clarus]|uniref:uncharacterized protein n=1 Tax=Epargyreus clarus TaxID=520877 RepID=UPI003C2EAFDB